MGLTRDKDFWEAFIAHANASVAAAELLSEMLANLDKAGEYAKKIKDLEHQGDKITHQTFSYLHKTWITPLDREEIHSLIKSLDDVLDFIEAASDKIALFQVRESTPEANDIAKVIIRATRAVREAVGEMQNIKNPQKIQELCVEINQEENAGDTLYRKAIAQLFQEAKDPINVIKWRDIYDSLENSVDACEDLANIIESIILEHS